MGKSSVPKQADVGARAGVSRATVSLVLNNKPGFSVPEETRQRVLAAARELGYVPNASARNLRTRKTSTIAAVIQDINNPFYPAFVRGVQDAAEHAGYDVIVYNTDSSGARERHFLDVLRPGRVDGVVGVFFFVGPAELSVLTGRGVPVAVLGPAPCEGASLGLVDRVVVNDRQAAREAVRYLISRGHERIAVASGPLPLLAGRVHGYEDAMAEAGLEAQAQRLFGPDFGEACGLQVGREVLARQERPSAFFAVNDLVAFGLLQAAREHSLRVPEDVALIGFDDIPAARWVRPALTTVDQFQQAIGSQCAELLLGRLSGEYTDPAPRTVNAPFQLKLRQSA